MYAEDTTNKAKKRMLKNWAVQFMDDKTNPKTSTASTVPDSKAFDNLLDICETIETESEVVVAEMDKSQIKNVGSISISTKLADSTYRLFKDIKKGISSLTKTNFKDLPRSDIGKASSYLDSLNVYYERLQGLALNVKSENLTIPPLTIETQIKRIEDEMDTINEGINDFNDAKRRIGFEIQIKEQDMEKKQEAYKIKYPLGLSLNSQKDLDYLDQKTQETDDIDRAIFSAEQRLKVLQPLLKKEKDNFKLAENKIARGKVSSIDYDLILKDYKIFLDTLQDGITRYNSGLSGKNNKISETVGAGRMCDSYIIGGTEYQHRRFM